MNKMIVSLFSRAPVHVGAGNSVGAVDAPVQRERHTRIPIIPGSSLKGVLADFWNNNGCRTAEGKRLFGEDDNAKDACSGSLLIGEARVLAFPVRSAKGMFAWITSPLALRRLQRESGMTYRIEEPKTDEALAFDDVTLDGNVVLEEYNFKRTGTPDQALITALSGLVKNDAVWQGIGKQLVIVSDEIFSHFCEHACEVVTRIRINDETGTVDGGGLFNQEQVPSETLFYSVAMATGDRTVATGEQQPNTPLQLLKARLEAEKIIQVGGDATIGLGFCSVHCMEVK